MSPLAPAILVFCLIFLSGLGIALILRRHERRRESKFIERAGVGESRGADDGLQPILIRPSGAEAGSALQRLISGARADAFVAKLCERAGHTKDPAAILRACAIAACVSGLCVIFVVPKAFMLAALPVMLASAYVPIWRLRSKVRRRLDRFEAQFPDGLEFIARSMRAGHAFSVSLEMLYREFEDPLASEFRRTFEEQNLGLPLEIALGKFSERVPLVDVRFFTSAVLLQRKTGGNLTEILDNLAHLIRERYKLRGKIRAVSAHGRMTGKALTAIPVFVGVLMFWMNRDYRLFFLTTVLGREMLAGSVALQIIGYLVINRIVNIEV
jgi:tight adherence protein B